MRPTFVVFKVKTTMTPSSDLYDLIQTLTKAEKRYFRLMASMNRRNGEHNCLKLFDEIEKMKTYDELKLRRLFPKKQLASTKYLLYDLLMKSLRQQHENKEIQANFDHYLQEVQILFQKGLYKQAERWLKKAKKLAEKYQITAGRTRIREWEHRLLYSGRPMPDNDPKRVDFSTTLNANETCRILRYVDLLGRMRALYESCSKRGVLCKLKAAHQLMQQPIVQNEHHPTCWRAQQIIREIHGLYALMNKDSDKAAAFFRQAIELLEIDQRYHAYPEDYRILVSNLVFTQLVNRLVQHPEEQTQRLNRLEALGHYGNDSARLQTRVLRFCIATRHQAFTEAEHWLEQIQTDTNLFDRIPGRFRMQFEFYRGVARFEQQHFSKAADAFEEVRKLEALGAFPNLQAAARVLDTFIHLENENFYFLEYQARTLKRYLKKKQLVGIKETVWLKALGQILHTKHHQERILVYRKLEQQIRQVTGHCLSGIPAAEQAIFSWLNAKGHPSNNTFRTYCNRNKDLKDLMAEPGEESFSLTA
ncbi:MAG: hypothetical protein AAF598_15590 [Bacteroidota bacterium]